MMTITFMNEDGDEEEIEVPSHWEICYGCEGHGTHLNRSIGEHAYSMEEFNESFDEEQQEQYFKRGGIYDVKCSRCNGTGKIQVPDMEKIAKETRDAIDEHHRREAYYRLCEAAERKMGY